MPPLARLRRRPPGLPDTCRSPLSTHLHRGAGEPRFGGRSQSFPKRVEDLAGGDGGGQAEGGAAGAAGRAGRARSCRGCGACSFALAEAGGRSSERAGGRAGEAGEQALSAGSEQVDDRRQQRQVVDAGEGAGDGAGIPGPPLDPLSVCRASLRPAPAPPLRSSDPFLSRTSSAAAATLDRTAPARD
nr:unnamed protein product [Digitaria exilis]